jgi:uncharacterized protein YbdZ (MbtH family)
MTLAVYDRNHRSDYQAESMWTVQIKYPDGWQTLETIVSDVLSFEVEEVWTRTRHSSFGNYRLRLCQGGKVVRYNK